MKLREEFVLKTLEPDANMAELCREYGISRKTGYKWKTRFSASGVAGLADMSRRPHASPLRASGEAVLHVLELRQQHPRWGAKKIRVVLMRTMDDVPSLRTIARILKRAGLVRRKRPRAAFVEPPEHTEDVFEGPNDIWTVDFKGWWLAGDGTRCEPLTVRDAFSRFVLCAQLMKTTEAKTVRARFEHLFEEHGLPLAIRVDNGPPFASTKSKTGLTTLSAWWISLGIRVIRGRPAHPQDNGAHERMHLDMRYEIEDCAADCFESQQVALDYWRHEFNHVRPHAALEFEVPAKQYRSSTRRYVGPLPAIYPAGWDVRKVASAGLIKWQGQSFRVGSALRGLTVGVQSINDDTIGVYFYELKVGEFALAA